MKKYALGLSLFAFIAITAACSSETKTGGNKALEGSWTSADGETKLKVTPKQFILDNGEPIPEDYFTKGDTIFTSYEGSRPYTQFIIQKLDAQQLSLLFPDSVVVEFKKQ